MLAIRRRAEATVAQLRQCHRPQDDPDLLETAAQQLCQRFLVFGRDVNTKGWAGHTLVCAKTFQIGIVLIESFQALKDLA